MSNNEFVPEIYIGENGNWFINGQDTGQPSRGPEGKSAYEIAKSLGFDGTEAEWLNTLRGKIGMPGPQGPTGPKGDTGEPGPAGIQGPQGPKGDKGDTGEKGEPGPQGLTGATGPQGPVGPQGLTGPQGPTGATGPQGLTGPKGDTGAQGPAGAQGCQGPKGDRGDAGPAGPKGDTGATGPAGPRGAQGIQGPKGDKGDRGLTGPQGPQGIPGAKGAKGDPGPVNLANNLTTTAAGYALDARQGKALKESIDSVNSKLTIKKIVNWGSGGKPASIPPGQSRDYTFSLQGFTKTPLFFLRSQGWASGTELISISPTSMTLRVFNNNNGGGNVDAHIGAYLIEPW